MNTSQWPDDFGTKMVVVKDFQPGAETNFEKRKRCMLYKEHSTYFVFPGATDPSLDWDMCLFLKIKLLDFRRVGC